MKRRPIPNLASFTLVEMLTVIAIIAILAGLTLSAFSGVMKTAARSRSRAEIQAISTALESYNSDNGAYPAIATFSDTNAYASANSSSSGGPYQLSSQQLYENLTGLTNFGDVPQAGTKDYMTSLKSNQLGNNSAGGVVYIKDPFGNSYGYFSGSAGSTPVNGTNQFDLWSTGGDVSGSTTGTNSWISNWGLGS